MSVLIPLAAIAILSTWSTAGACLYNATMGYFNSLRDFTWRQVAILGTVIGLVAAMTGIIGNVTNLLIAIGLIVPPVGAVIIADHSVVRRPHGFGLDRATAINGAAIAASLLGIGTGVWMYFSFPNFTFGIPWNSVSALRYVVLAATFGATLCVEKPTIVSTAESDGAGKAAPVTGTASRARGKGQTMAEICSMSGTELTEAVRERRISPTEVVDAVAERMDALEPTLHAFCTPTLDLAREQAQRLANRISAGEDPGPLAGVPVAVKDLVATKGIRTVGGSAAYRDFVPEEDDVVVERLKSAGALIVGKTNVPEFGYSAVGHNPVFETTRNPWNPGMTPGGSSAGSGAAVAAGMAPMAVGSDGGGSVRIPAAHCGLFGMKPSMGRVPLYPGCRDERYPGFSSWESLEHIGPMTRTVADSALMLSIMAGPDPRDRHSIPARDVDWVASCQGGTEGMRIAYSPNLGYAAVDPQVREIVERAVQVFEKDLGCEVEQAEPGFDDPYNDFWGLVVLESDLRGMRAMAREHPMSPHLVDLLSQPWTAEDLTNAVIARKAVCNKMWRFMENYDLLLTPTLTVPPFPVHTQGPERVDGRMVPPFQWLSFTLPFNMTGQPAASVPAGWTEDGLPVGLQIVGRHLADEAVLRASAAFENAAPWANRWPGLVTGTR